MSVTVPSRSCPFPTTLSPVHLFADPIYDPQRCSIGFHPLHQFIPIGFYGLMTISRRLRVMGLGLLIHMLLDLGDCISMELTPWF